MAHWAERYMTLRFLDGGRDFPAVDCWGLVRLVLARECGIDIPSYGDVPASALARIARNMARDSDLPPWRAFEGEPRMFDGVMMTANPGARVDRRACVHAGIVTGPGRMIHIEDGQGVHHVAFDHVTVKRRLLGFRRHEALS